MKRKRYYLSQAVWLSPNCSISVWCRTQDINMQLPSLPGFDNNSCKCQPDHYCLSSIPESLNNVSSPTVILYTSISVSAIHFSLLVCALLCLFVPSLLLVVSRLDSSHPVCNPSDPLPCLFPCGIKLSVSSADSWTCGQEREREGG